MASTSRATGRIPDPGPLDPVGRVILATSAMWAGRPQDGVPFVAPDFSDLSPMPPYDDGSLAIGQVAIEVVVPMGRVVGVSSSCAMRDLHDDAVTVWRDISVWRLDRQGRLVSRTGARSRADRLLTGLESPSVLAQDVEHQPNPTREERQ